jgi:hypothetical protein
MRSVQIQRMKSVPHNHSATRVNFGAQLGGRPTMTGASVGRRRLDEQEHCWTSQQWHPISRPLVWERSLRPKKSGVPCQPFRRRAESSPAHRGIHYLLEPSFRRGHDVGQGWVLESAALSCCPRQPNGNRFAIQTASGSATRRCRPSGSFAAVSPLP